MADISHFLFFSFFILLGFTTTTTTSEAAQTVPAMYVFGDSLVDVGNNNYICTFIKANFLPNGIDFYNGQPTGRCSNGKNSADFLAEKVGLSTPPPYLSLESESSNGSVFLTGVSFASAGAGIFNSTNSEWGVISLEEQFGYYTRVHESVVQQLGPDGAQNHLSKSIFTIVVGNNDMFVHFAPQSPNTTQQYVDSMISNFKELLMRLYNLGARKLMIAGIGAIGCCPAMRVQNNGSECQEDINKWSAKYNEGLKSMLTQLELKDMHYSYFDTYILFQEFIQQPATYGFSDVRAACCGWGNLQAALPCLPHSPYCNNRSDHLFWDQYHPTQKAAGIIVDFIFNGSQNYVTPINLKQLVAV